MIPGFDDTGNLPPGVHSSTWEEVVQRFSWTPRRRVLLTGLKSALVVLRSAGCQRIYLNGSFVTSKDEPGDIDVAWDPDGVDVDRLLDMEPVFGDFSYMRAGQKARFGCEFFPSNLAADLVETTFLEFFQIDRESEAPKGIVLLELGSLP